MCNTCVRMKNQFGSDCNQCDEKIEQLKNAKEFFVELVSELTSFKDFDESKVDFLISELAGYLGACGDIDDSRLTISRTQAHFLQKAIA